MAQSEPKPTDLQLEHSRITVFPILLSPGFHSSSLPTPVPHGRFTFEETLHLQTRSVRELSHGCTHLTRGHSCPQHL